MSNLTYNVEDALSLVLDLGDSETKTESSDVCNIYNNVLYINSKILNNII